MAFRMRSFKQRPILPFFYDDWRSSSRVQAMCYEARGLYMALLMEQWDHRLGSLPATVEELAALLRIPARRFAKHWSILQPCFTVTKRGRLRNPKLARIRTASRKWYDSQRAISVAGAGKSDRKVLTGQQLDMTLRTVPYLTKKKTRAGRAHLASARDTYLAACPHDPRCQSVRLCGDRRALDEALAEGRLAPAQAARLLHGWGVEV